MSQTGGSHVGNLLTGSAIQRLLKDLERAQNLKADANNSVKNDHSKDQELNNLEQSISERLAMALNEQAENQLLIKEEEKNVRATYALQKIEMHEQMDQVTRERYTEILQIKKFDKDNISVLQSFLSDNIHKMSDYEQAKMGRHFQRATDPDVAEKAIKEDKNIKEICIKCMTFKQSVSLILEHSNNKDKDSKSAEIIKQNFDQALRGKVENLLKGVSEDGKTIPPEEVAQLKAALEKGDRMAVADFAEKHLSEKTKTEITKSAQKMQMALVLENNPELIKKTVTFLEEKDPGSFKEMMEEAGIDPKATKLDLAQAKRLAEQIDVKDFEGLRKGEAKEKIKEVAAIDDTKKEYNREQAKSAEQKIEVKQEAAKEAEPKAEVKPSEPAKNLPENSTVASAAAKVKSDLENKGVGAQVAKVDAAVDPQMIKGGAGAARRI